FFFCSSRRRHTRSKRDWSSDVCSSDLPLNNSLTDAQLVTLREEVKVRHPQQRLDVGDLIILGSYTGLRINEANSLRWEDVHLGDERSFLTVEGQVYGSGTDRRWEPLLKRESSR